MTPTADALGSRFGFAIACGGHDELVLAAVRSISRSCDPRCHIAVTFDGHQPDEDTLNELSDAMADVRVTVPQRGISHAWNTGILACFAAGCDLVCVLNDDAEVPAGFDRMYADFFDHHLDVRIACSLDRLTAGTIFPDIKAAKGEAWCSEKLPASAATRDRLYESEGGFEAFAKAVAARTDAPEFLPCRMNGACFVMRRSCLWELGLFDEGFGPPGTHEDLDVWLRCLTRLGPDSMGTFSRSFVHHLRAVTISSYPRERAQVGIAANSARYRQRWPREQWGDIEDWFSAANSTAAAGVVPPAPRESWKEKR